MKKHSANEGKPDCTYQFGETLTFATTVIENLSDFLDKSSRGALPQFRRVNGVMEIPESTLKQINIFSNFFKHYQHQVEQGSENPLFNAIAPTVVDQISGATVDKLLNMTKYGNGILFVSQMAKTIDDYAPFHHAINRMVKHQNQQLSTTLNAMPDDYRAAIHVAMALGAREQILDAEFTLKMTSMFARAVDGSVDFIINKAGSGVDAVKKFFKPSYQSSQSVKEKPFMKTYSSHPDSRNYIDDVVQEKLTILIAQCGDNHHKVNELTTHFLTYVSQYKSFVKEISNKSVSTEIKIGEAIQRMSEVNDRLSDIDRRMRIAEQSEKQKARVLAEMQGVIDLFGFIQNLGHVTQDKNIQVFGAVSLAISQVVIGAAQLSTAMATSTLMSLATLTPVTAIMGGLLTIGSMFLSSGKKQGRGIQQVFRAISDQITRLEKCTLEGFNITFKNQERICQLLIENFSVAKEYLNYIIYQNDKIAFKMDTLSHDMMEIKQTLQKHVLIGRFDGAKKAQQYCERLINAFVENKQTDYQLKIVKCMQLVQEQLLFSLHNDCRNLPNKHNQLSGWFHLLLFRDILQSREFREFKIELNDVVNLIWWRNIVDSYLPLTFFVSMDSKSVRSIKKSINEQIISQAISTKSYLDIISDPKFIEAFLRYYENKLSEVHNEATKIIDGSVKNLSKEGMIDFARQIITEKKPIQQWQPILHLIKQETEYHLKNSNDYLRLSKLVVKYNTILESFIFGFMNLFLNSDTQFFDLYPQLNPIDSEYYQHYKYQSCKVEIENNQVDIYYLSGHADNLFKTESAHSASIDAFSLKIKGKISIYKQYLNQAHKMLELSNSFSNASSPIDTQSDHFSFKSNQEEPTMFKQSQSTVDHHWYDSDEIHALFFLIQQDNINVDFLTSVLGNDTRSGNTLRDQLIQYQQERKSKINSDEPINNKVIIPINLGTYDGKGIHWVLAYVEYEEKCLKPVRIFYVDPLGKSIPDDVLLAFQDSDSFGDTSVDTSKSLLQNDGYNCGPWIVAITEFLLDTLKLTEIKSISALLNNLQSMNIDQARSRQQELLEDYNDVFNRDQKNSKDNHDETSSDKQSKSDKSESAANFRELGDDLEKIKAKFEAECLELDEHNLNEVIDLIKDACRVIVPMNGNDVVALFGNSGSGKSTISNCMIGCDYKVEGTGDFAEITQVGDKKELFKRGNEVDSETLLPQVERLPGKNLALCDPPGYHDNRGDAKRVFSATVTHLLKHALKENQKAIKGIIYVLEGNLLTKKGKEFRENMLSIGKTMQCKYRLIQESFVFIINKQPNLTFEKFKQYVKDQYQSLEKIEHRNNDEEVIYNVVKVIKFMTEDIQLHHRFHIVGNVIGGDLRDNIMSSIEGNTNLNGCTKQSPDAIDFMCHNHAQALFVEQIKSVAKMYIIYTTYNREVSGILREVEGSLFTRAQAVSVLEDDIKKYEKQQKENRGNLIKLEKEHTNLQDDLKILQAAIVATSEQIQAIERKTELKEIDTIRQDFAQQMVPENQTDWHNFHARKRYYADAEQIAIRDIQAKGWVPHPSVLKPGEGERKANHFWTMMKMTRIIAVPSKEQGKIRRETKPDCTHPIVVKNQSSNNIRLNLIHDSDCHKKWEVAYPLGENCLLDLVVCAQERFTPENIALIQRYQDTKAKHEQDKEKKDSEISDKMEAINTLKSMLSDEKGATDHAEQLALLKKYQAEIKLLQAKKALCLSECDKVRQYLFKNRTTFKSVCELLVILKLTDEGGIFANFLRQYTSNPSTKRASNPGQNQYSTFGSSFRNAKSKKAEEAETETKKEASSEHSL